MLLWDAPKEEAPIWSFCYTFGLTDQVRKKKNIWKNHVFYFLSNQELWGKKKMLFILWEDPQQHVQWSCMVLMLSTSGRGEELLQRRLHQREGLFSFFLFFFLLKVTGRVKASISLIGICWTWPFKVQILPWRFTLPKHTDMHNNTLKSN